MRVSVELVEIIFDENDRDFVDQVTLGDFEFGYLPREGDTIALIAFGSYNPDKPTNYYKVLQVFHHGCHTSWDSAAFQAREEDKGPSTKLHIKFVYAQTGDAYGGYSRSSKGQLRRT